MNNGYYTAAGAMVTQLNNIDVIANNLANLNTVAFKQDNTIVADFERIYQEKRDNLELKDNTKEASKFLNRSIDRVPQVSDEYVNFAQGGIKHTGNTLDFSLKRGDAFFMVETPDGPKLTQNGSFTLNSKGQLMTKEGYSVLPASYLTNTNSRINFEQDAQVTVDKSGNIYSNGDAVGQLLIVTPDNLKMVQKQGDNLFSFEDNDLERLDQLQDDDVVIQGFIETSNVKPVIQMTRLVESSRLIEMYQKVMTTHMDDLNEQAISKLATSKA